MGFMMGIDLVSDKQSKESLVVAQRVFEKCIERGVIIRPVASVIVISPPLVFTKENIDTLIFALKESLDEVAQELKNEQVI